MRVIGNSGVSIPCCTLARWKQIQYFPHWYEDLTSELRRTYEKVGYDLIVPMSYSVPYEKMHHFLNDFDIFVDRFSIRRARAHVWLKMVLREVEVGKTRPIDEHIPEVNLENKV